MTKSRTGRTRYEVPVLAVLIALAVLVLAVTGIPS
jgi:hypothetical protein